MKVHCGVRPSQPLRPRVRAAAREGVREALTGETMGWVLSCETGFSEVPISFCYGEGNIISRDMAMCGMDLAQSETPCAWRRPLCGTWEASCRPQPR